jgi:hypothetical protein
MYAGFTGFGGFLTMALPLGQYAIAGIEGFQEDSSVIKKLYSSKKTSKKARKLEKFNKVEANMNELISTSGIKNTETKEMINEIFDR